MFKSKIAENILAEHLINNGAVSFLTERPMRLKSGLITPIYVDNRRLTAVPEAWRDILETMAPKVVELGLEFDIVASKALASPTPPLWPTASTSRASSFVRPPRPTATRAASKAATSPASASSSSRTTSPPASRSSPPSKASRLKAPRSRTASPSPPSASTRPTSSSKSSKSAATK